MLCCKSLLRNGPTFWMHETFPWSSWREPWPIRFMHVNGKETTVTVPEKCLFASMEGLATCSLTEQMKCSLLSACHKRIKDPVSWVASPTAVLKSSFGLGWVSRLSLFLGLGVFQFSCLAAILVPFSMGHLVLEPEFLVPSAISFEPWRI